MPHFTTLKKWMPAAILFVILVCACVFLFPREKSEVQVAAESDAIIFSPTSNNESDKANAQKEHLQGVLEQAVEKVDSIQKASVQITEGAGELAPMVSVSIALKDGAQLSMEQEESIKVLLKGSISNITEDNISISVG